MAFDQQLKDASVAEQRKRLQYGLFGLAMLLLLTVAIGGINHFSAEPVVEPQPTIPLVSAAENERARAQFKRDLQRFEQQVEPQLLNPELKSWDQVNVMRLVDAKQAALDAFGVGNYTVAVQQLSEVSQQTQQLVNDWDQAFTESLSQATSYFEQDKNRRAGLYITEALTIKPTNSDALALKRRLDVLPKITQLLAQSKVANVENNLPREAQLLQKVLALDPLRQTLNSRIDTIKATIKDQRFNAKIAAGLQFVADGQISSAMNVYNQARKIDPKRKELRLLSNKIKKSATGTALEMAIVEVEMLIVQDDWTEVLSATRSLNAQFKNNAQLQQSQILAEQLVTLEKKIDAYLARPKRLSDTNVGAKVSRFIDNNTEVAQNSSRITEKLGQLTSQLKTYSASIEVTLHSDGKTDITVIGLGHVGKTEERQVQLSPGKYVFEGSRKGYRSTRIELTIAANSTNQEVTVICHERI